MSPEPRTGSSPRRTGVWLFLGGLALCAVLVVAELPTTRHPHFEWEERLGFYGFYSFLSCVVLVLGARILRRIVSRDESYYD